MRSSITFNPARALPPAKPPEKVERARKISINFYSENNPTPENIASMKKRIVDKYSPSTNKMETPLTLYKFNPTTKTIKKISIIDG